MNILVINGSPKGNKSNTMKITNKFLEGLSSKEKNKIKIINVNEERIDHCLGCFACWDKTTGKCIINDSMDEIIEAYLDSELVIWSFPLYYFSMPSKIKALMDRMLPLNLPFMDKEVNNGSSHVQRYDCSKKKYLLISTCGFHSVENNYEGLIKQFQILYGNNMEMILCPEGELLSVKELNKITGEYLKNIKKAGEEFSSNSKFSKDTREELRKLFFPPEVFIEMANESWNIPNTEEIELSKGEKLLKQMKYVYDCKSISHNKEIILEFYFTDLKEKYQFILNNKACKLIKGNFRKYTTKIEVSFALWEKISKGEVRGDNALFNKEYFIYGDIEVLMDLDKYFPTSDSNKEIFEDSLNKKKTNMTLLFLPWLFFWITINFNNHIAGIYPLLILGILPFILEKYKLSLYDKISMFFASIFGILSLAELMLEKLYFLSFLLMGSIWLFSMLKKYPLTAEYSINRFKDTEIKDNFIFLKTNKILTLMWGVVYYLLAFLFLLPLNSFEKLLINPLIPVLVLLFTNYFANTYPNFLMKKYIKIEG